MLFATNSDVFVLNIGKILLILSMFYIVYLYLRKRNCYKHGYTNDSLLLIVWLFLTMCTVIVNFDMSQRPIVKIVLLISSFFLAKIISLEQYAKIYCRIMNIIGITSVVMFLLHNYFRTASYLPTIKNTNGYNFKSLIFANIAESTLPVMHRNIGPFWEPGTYQAYLILAIVFSLFLNFKTKDKIKNIIIYIIALIFTYSTTGYIAIIPLIMAYILANKNVSNRWVKLFLSIICVLAVCYVLQNQEVYSLVFGKITAGNHSYISRVGSLQDGIAVALNNPLFGVGPVQFENILNGIAIVNTTVMHFAVYGGCVGIIYIYCMYRFSRGCTNNIFPALFVAMALIISTAGENLTYSFVFNLILFLKADSFAKKKSSFKSEK